MLASSSSLSGLQILDLENNPLGDKSALAARPKAPFIKNLVSLELTHCKIGDAGAKALANAVSEDKIINLNLHSDNEISEAMRKKLHTKFGDHYCRSKQFRHFRLGEGMPDA